MKNFCQNPYCDSPGAKVVPVSVEESSDEKRTLCVPCEEAYTWGVQHGRKVTESELATLHPSTGLNVNRRQLATVLAGLRFFADENLQGTTEIPDVAARNIATDGGTLKPLSFDEVNALCEHLNFDAIRPGMQVAPPPKEGKGSRLYRVVYSIDVSAANAIQAAQQTYQILLDPDSVPPVVDVIDHRGRVRRVDLSEQRNPRRKGRQP